MIQEYSINEALEILDISKATLYHRMDKHKQKLEGRMFTKKGKRYISIEGLEFLKICESLDSTDNNLNSLDGKENYNVDVFEVLKAEIEFLKSQIIEKDNQIQTLSKLVENSQVLLKNEQQTRLLLTDSKENVFNKIKKWFSS